MEQIAHAEAWLTLPNGTSLRVRPSGTLFGRDPVADVVLGDPRASQRQALVLAGPRGVELVALGRNPTVHNGQEVRGVAQLQDGDVVGVPGLEVRVRCRLPPTGGPLWLLEVDDRVLGLPASAFSVGAFESDLAVPGWPPGAVRLHRLHDALLIELLAPGTIDGAPREAPRMELVTSGTTVMFSEQTIRLVSHGSATATTTMILDEVPTIAHLSLEVLPRGARLNFTYGAAEFELWLSETRYRLVATLLDPSRPSGSFVEDDIVLKSVWPRQPGKSRVDVNVLIHRLRADLLRVGAHPMVLVERAPPGGATRLRVSERTTLERR